MRHPSPLRRALEGLLRWALGRPPPPAPLLNLEDYRDELTTLAGLMQPGRCHVDPRRPKHRPSLPPAPPRRRLRP